MSAEGTSQSNKFLWETYKAPRWSHSGEDAEQNEKSLQAGEEPTSPYHTFTIRHLKQGATGARKTWEASNILLNQYLLCEGGPLRGNGGNNHGDQKDSSSCSSEEVSTDDDHCNNQYNIMELGSGAGCLAIGLATALNHEACKRQRLQSQIKEESKKTSFHPRASIICTDIDKPTIKNLRHNIASQPNDRNVRKAVKVASLGWGNAVGGAAFDKALTDQFSKKRKVPPTSSEKLQSSTDVQGENEEHREDPMSLLTHLIGADLLYGEGAHEPLSDVISAIKMRNPDIVVILMLREYSPNAVANLKASIEGKICRGLTLRLKESAFGHVHGNSSKLQNLLETFSVNVRDVVANTIDNVQTFKVVEC